jgi:hypothetical protein
MAIGLKKNGCNFQTDLAKSCKFTPQQQRPNICTVAHRLEKYMFEANQKNGEI